MDPCDLFDEFSCGMNIDHESKPFSKITLAPVVKNNFLIACLPKSSVRCKRGAEFETRYSATFPLGECES